MTAGPRAPRRWLSRRGVEGHGLAPSVVPYFHSVSPRQAATIPYVTSIFFLFYYWKVSFNDKTAISGHNLFRGGQSRERARRCEWRSVDELPSGDDCKVMSLGSGWTQTRGCSQRCGTVLYEHRANRLLFFLSPRILFFFSYLDTNPDLERRFIAANTVVHGVLAQACRVSCSNHSKGCAADIAGEAPGYCGVGRCMQGNVVHGGVHGRPWSRAQVQQGP